MRRQFLKGLAAAVACSRPRSLARGSAAVSLDLHEREAGDEIPVDFIGLSYETAQVTNRDFFSPADKQLVDLFRELTPTGYFARVGTAANLRPMIQGPGRLKSLDQCQAEA